MYFYIMKTVQSIFETLEARRKELGLSQAEVGRRALGQADGSVLQNMKRGSSPSPESLDKICRVLNLDFYIGPRRDSGPVKQVLLEGTDFAPVHHLDVRLSAGPGAENGDTDIIGTLAFRRDWLDKMGVTAREAVLVRVQGDSMQPGLHDGDLALVDTAQKIVRSGQIYAVTDIDSQTLVKRIDTLGGEGLLLRSDNPDFAPMARLGDDANGVTIHGRVVWSGHVWT
jgi:phage repressor protein C with HTH and peptisase S24 domain